MIKKMSNIAVIDADIIGKKKHRFPNLCCMKLSSYHKRNGDSVILKTDYDNLDDYDKVYISKVFTDTEVPGEPEDKRNKTSENIAEWYSNNEFLKRKNIEYGGTGFFYDKAPPLPDEIEHIMPDYHLYDEWVNNAIANGVKRSEFTYYLDYSIGYLTRKCFRGCYYCVNRNYKGTVRASPLSEFLDDSRPKVCFLDDNFWGYAKWRELIQPVIDSGKRFQFKQGLDERLLTVDKILEISKWKYDGEMIFAFDNIEDKDLIVSKLELIRQTAPNWKRELKFYVFCGCDKEDKYDELFWETDIRNLFDRIEILSRYGAKPYIMRFEKVYESKFSSFYAAVAAWCNQPSIFNTFTFRLFCQCRGMRKNGYKLYKRDIEQYLKDIGIKGSEWKAMEMVESLYPYIAQQYYDFKGKSNTAHNIKSEKLLK